MDEATAKVLIERVLWMDARLSYLESIVVNLAAIAKPEIAAIFEDVSLEAGERHLIGSPTEQASLQATLQGRAQIRFGKKLEELHALRVAAARGQEPS